MATTISRDNLTDLVKHAMDHSYRVVGPAADDGLVLFKELAAPSDLHLEAINPKNSIKEFFFPKTETLFSYKKLQKDVEVVNENGAISETVIIGSRPCDAMSLERLDKLFDWDYHDSFYFKRREATCLISIACSSCDDACFCTSLGFDPKSTEGSDILLIPCEGDVYKVDTITDKGSALMEEFDSLFTDAEAGQEQVASPEKRFDLDRIRPWLENNFEHDFWKEVSMPCIGCGTCTFLCPTCHCFDIVDEGGIDEGARIKNWDTCQSKLFTLHTSGHNPRPTQDTRWRQRIRHKFQYYVEKFNTESCVGCGRCIRYCPTGMNIIEQLQKIAEMEAQSTRK